LAFPALRFFLFSSLHQLIRLWMVSPHGPVGAPGIEAQSPAGRNSEDRITARPCNLFFLRSKKSARKINRVTGILSGAAPFLNLR
jgi:hypothetical protein